MRKKLQTPLLVVGALAATAIGLAWGRGLWDRPSEDAEPLQSEQHMSPSTVPSRAVDKPFRVEPDDGSGPVCEVDAIVRVIDGVAVAISSSRLAVKERLDQAQLFEADILPSLDMTRFKGASGYTGIIEDRPGHFIIGKRCYTAVSDEPPATNETVGGVPIPGALTDEPIRGGAVGSNTTCEADAIVRFENGWPVQVETARRAVKLRLSSSQIIDAVDASAYPNLDGSAVMIEDPEGRFIPGSRNCREVD